MRIRGFLVDPSAIVPTTRGLRGPPPGLHQPAHGGAVPRPRRSLRLRFTPRPLQTPQGSTLLRQDAFVHCTPRFRKEFILRHFTPFQSTAVLITLVQVPSMGDQACGVEDHKWIQFLILCFSYILLRIRLALHQSPCDVSDESFYVSTFRLFP